MSSHYLNQIEPQENINIKCNNLSCAIFETTKNTKNFNADNTVTQITSQTTSVTINDYSGSVTTFELNIPAGVTITFNISNDKVRSPDRIIYSIQQFSDIIVTNGIPFLLLTSVGTSNQIRVDITNIHPTNALTGTIEFYFQLISNI